jgi:hypothetical protein
MPSAQLLKIGPVTNLQDARACAAWGVDYLSFSLERGSLYKVNDALLLSVLEWLAGPLPVISLGDDVEPIGELMARDWGGSIAFEVNAAHWAAVPDDAPVLWTLTPDDLFRAPDALIRRWQSAVAIELHPPQGIGAALPPLLRQLKAAAGFTPVLLRADGLPAELLDHALSLCDGLSVAPMLPTEFGLLDYDAVEQVLDRYRTEVNAS